MQSPIPPISSWTVIAGLIRNLLYFLLYTSIPQVPFKIFLSDLLNVNYKSN